MKLLIVIILSLFISTCKKEETFNPYASGGDGQKLSRPSYVFKYDGKEYDKNSIPKEVRRDRYKIDLKRYLSYYNAVESYNIRVAFMEDKGITDMYGSNNVVPSFQKIFEENLNPRIIEEEYKKNRSRYARPGMTEEAIKGQIKYQLTLEAIEPQYMNKRAELYERNKLHINILPPDIRETGFSFQDNPRLGERDSKFQIIAITNYNCKACRKTNERVNRLFSKYGKDLSYIHVNHTFAPIATTFDAALASHCVGLGHKTKYWHFHKEMYSDPTFDKGDAMKKEEYKKSLGRVLDKVSIPSKEVFECMGNMQNKRLISEKMISFKEMGITNVPAYFLNGRQLVLLTDEGLESAFNNMAKSLGLIK